MFVSFDSFIDIFFIFVVFVKVERDGGKKSIGVYFSVV